MIEVTDKTFEAEVANSPIPVVIDFWAPWCVTCKHLTPIMEDLAVEFDGQVKFVMVNISDNPNIAQRFGVRGLPTMAIVKDGATADISKGMASKDVLRGWIRLTVAAQAA